jgi:putative transcriptional regulator
MTKSKGTKIVERLKNFAEVLETNESISDHYTRRTVRLNLELEEYNGDLVRKTRKLLGASQAVFSQFLGVSVKTVHDWEQDRKVPKEVACRFMDEIRNDPSYWLRRLRKLSTVVDGK